MFVEVVLIIRFVGKRTKMQKKTLTIAKLVSFNFHLVVPS